MLLAHLPQQQLFLLNVRLGVRLKGKVAVAGDGQVTLGDMAMKQKAVKVRKFDSSKGGVVGGFAGAAADALTLFEKFEQKLAFVQTFQIT